MSDAPICSSCKERPRTLYRTRRTAAGKLRYDYHSYCKECQAEKNRLWREENYTPPSGGVIVNANGTIRVGARKKTKYDFE
jgi:hypothetical protein